MDELPRNAMDQSDAEAWRFMAYFLAACVGASSAIKFAIDGAPEYVVDEYTAFWTHLVLDVGTVFLSATQGYVASRQGKAPAIPRSYPAEDPPDEPIVPARPARPTRARKKKVE